VTATAAFAGLRPVANAFGLLRGDRVQARYRNLRALRDALDHRLERGPRPGRDRLRPARLQRDPIREPPAGEIHPGGEDDEGVEEHAPEERADPDEESSQAGEEEPGSGLGREALGADGHRGLLPRPSRT
jgi:hypothetical protein